MLLGKSLRVLRVGKSRPVVVPVDEPAEIVEAMQVVIYAEYAGIVASVDLDAVGFVLSELV
jgi:hypothetical protein